MKTSTIILISLFSIVGIFLLSLLIQVEGKPNRQLTNNLNVESHALHKFSHLKVGRGCKLSYIQANGDSIRIGYTQENKLEKPLFTVREDTLFVRNGELKDLSFIEVYASGVNSIRVDSSYFEVKLAKTPALRISAKTSTVKFLGNTFIDTAYLKLNDCTLLGNQAKIKKLELNMEKTEIKFDR